MRSSLIFLTVLALWLLVPALASLQAQPSYTTYTQVALLGSDSSTIPAVAARWRNTQLPYRLVVDTPDTTFAWFRLSLPAPDYAQPVAIYLSSHLYSVDVYLNGIRVAGTQQPPGKLALGWTQPLLMSLPNGLWHPGTNVLHLRLTQAGFTNFLPPLLVGPEYLLLPIWQSRQFWHTQLALLALVMCVLMGLFTAGLWLQRRDDLEFAWFAGAALSMSLPLYYLNLGYAVLPHAFLLFGTCLGGVWSFGCLLLFLGRLVRMTLPGWEKSLLLIVALASVSLPLLTVADISKVLILVYGVGVASLLLICRQAAMVRQSLPVAYWVAGTAVLMGLAGLRDLAMLLVDGIAALSSAGLYLPWLLPIILSIFFAHLVRRYLYALHNSEVLGEQLELRVAAISTELEASYKANRELELEDAAQSQRQKIYQDLHDDVGSRLLAIVHADESQRQSTMAQSALSSLRDTVSTSHVSRTLLPVLVEQISEELALRCRSQDLEFTLRLGGTLPVVSWEGERAHHLWRILQEIVNNSVRHAQASAVVMFVEYVADELLVSVADDGDGFELHLYEGAGIRNIRYRAHQLKARIQWRRGTTGGTCFTLRLPVQDAGQQS